MRRVWLHNVHPAKLWSAILARPISINCTAAALRAVDRAGGVDNYLLRTSDERLASAAGTRLRRLLLDTLKRDARRDARLARPAAAADAAAGQPAPQQQPPPQQQLR